MDFSLTEDQQLLVENLKELLARIMPPEKQEEYQNAGTFPWAEWKELAECGFVGVGWPEELGGTPADMMTQMLVNLTISRMGGMLGAYFTLGMTTVYDVVEFGTKEQKEKYAIPFVQGGAPLSLAVSEPSTGSDVASMQTSYKKDGDYFIINGTKHYTTGAAESKAIIVMAKDAKVKNVHAAGTMFIVDTDTPGLSINKLHKFSHETGATSICECFFKDVRVHKSAILGREHRGFMQTMSNFARERLANVSGSLATAINAFEDACTYANQRVQFGQTIGNFQLIQEMIMEMACRIENMYNMICKLCWKIDQGMDIRIEQGMAKYYCARATFEVVDMATQVLCGIGVVGDHRVGRYFTDARVGRIAGGTDQVMIFNTVPEILKKYK